MNTMDPKEQAPQTTPQQDSPEASTPPAPPEEKSTGPLIGIIVVIVLLVLGAGYFWYDTYINTDTSVSGPDQPTPEDIMNAEDPVVEQLQTQNSSDNISSIEADLEASNYDNLDADFTNIESELNAQ